MLESYLLGTSIILGLVTSSPWTRWAVNEFELNRGAWAEGAAVDAPSSAPPPNPAIRMSQNDLWIAATAHAADLKLLSTDKGFAHLDKIWIEHIYVDQGNRA